MPGEEEGEGDQRRLKWLWGSPAVQNVPGDQEAEEAYRTVTEQTMAA